MASPRSQAESTFTIHDDIFSVRSNWKYLCGLKTFLVPTKIIFNAFWNNFGLVIFICAKQTRMRFYYSWRQFFASIKSENISVSLRIIPVPTKMILDLFWNNFRLVTFICEKHLKWFRQLRSISSYYPGKFQKASRMILAPSKNYQACAETNLTSRYPLKQLFSFTETHPMTPLCGTFSVVRNFSGVQNFFGDFLSDSLSSIQQIDDP